MTGVMPWRAPATPSSLRREMDELWNRFLGETPVKRFGFEEWVPSVDISETDDKIVARAELPGMDADDIDISVSGDLLTIQGEKKEENERKEESFYSSERYYGTFQRSFRLPAAVDSEKVEATFKNGVLTINLPKAQEAKRRKITVKAA